VDGAVLAQAAVRFMSPHFALVPVSHCARPTQTPVQIYLPVTEVLCDCGDEEHDNLALSRIGVM
jgi:hypothetical protein